MKAQQSHHQPVAHTFLNLDNAKDFAPLFLRGKILSDDSCWDEFDSECDESIPSSLLADFDDADFE
jgi:hypothetical protein